MTKKNTSRRGRAESHRALSLPALLIIAAGILWSPLAWASAGVIESVTFTSNQDGLEFLVKTNGKVNPQDVAAGLEKAGRVVVIRMDGLAVDRQWVNAQDAMLQRTLIQPDNSHGQEAVMQLRLTEPMDIDTLSGARVVSSERQMRLLIPRNEAVAQAWIASGRGIAMGRIKPKKGKKTGVEPITNNRPVDPDSRRIALPKNVPVTQLPSRLHNSRKSVTDAVRAMARHHYERITMWKGVRRLAVLPAHPSDSLTADEHFQRVGTALLTDRLSHQPRVLTVDGASLEAALGRLGVGPEGPSDEQALAIGRMFGADAVLVSKVSITTDNQVEMRSRALGLKGQLVSNTSQLISRRGMERVRDDIVNEQSAGAGIWRSVLMPGWGQIYNGDTGRGAAYMTAFLGLVAAAAWSASLGVAAERDYQENDPRTISQRVEADAHYDRTNTLLVGVGVVWAAALLDAIVSGESRADLDLGDYGVRQ